MIEKQNKLIVYQVLPRLFGNNNNYCVNNGSLEANGCGKFNDFTPKALGEIKKLGSHIFGTQESLNTPRKPITVHTAFNGIIRLL